MDINRIAGIPPVSYADPIWYRGYRIYPGDWMPWSFVHDDYDPTPVHADDGPSDHRHGYGKTVSDCREQIDGLEDEA
jgi:hypothetical protein